jgi:arylsulfatase A-like enzyme
VTCNRQTEPTRSRRCVAVLFAALSLGLLLAATGCRKAADRPPNIVVVLVDTLRADYLGTYGFEGAISPNLDRLAAESVVYENCIAQSPWTKPSVASLFTSLYPQVHGLTNHEGKYWGAHSEARRTGILPEDAVTLAEGLSAAGYVTAGFVSNPWVKADYGFAQGFNRYDESATVAWDDADSLIGNALEWIEALPEEQPFFVYLHFMDVHAPYDAPQEDYDALIDSASLGRTQALQEKQRPERKWQNIERRAAWASEEMRSTREYWRARYGSGVRAMDRRMGQLLEFLRLEPQAKQTLLVVTSDHGEELFEHHGWSHGQSLYEHQLRVPLMIRPPGDAEGGIRVQRVVELIDLMPTLLDAAGAAPVERAQGRPLGGGEQVDLEERVAFATATQRSPGLFAVRTSQYKLLHNIDNGRTMLFDLHSDPAERLNIALREPETTERLKALLTAHLTESLSAGTLDKVTTEMPAELQERLKALGYLD